MKNAEKRAQKALKMVVYHDRRKSLKRRLKNLEKSKRETLRKHWSEADEKLKNNLGE